MKKHMKVPSVIIGMSIFFLVLVIVCLLFPVINPVDLGATDLTDRLIPPAFMDGGEGRFVLGTDNLGRDFMKRLIYATRNSLIIATGGIVLAVMIGTVLGAIAGMKGGTADNIICFVVDALLSVPFIIVAIVCAAVFGTAKSTMILIMGMTGWATFARLIRGQILMLREENYIKCSHALGASGVRIFFEHILPNIAAVLLVHGTISLSSFILLESSLSFLGLGIQPPDVSLGVMVSSGRDYLINFWWLSILPSVVIVTLVLIISLVGDWLRNCLDPKLKNN